MIRGRSCFKMKFKLRAAPLDLALTLSCGQAFRWSPVGHGAWRGPIGTRLVTLRTVGTHVHAEATPGRSDAESAVAEYLRLGDNIGLIQKTLSDDPVLARGIAPFRGLRIVKMDEWECLASYVLATYANILRISKMIEAIAMSYGTEITEGVHAFPSLSQLSGASVADLRRLGLGYRADHIHGLCGSLGPGDIRRMKRLPYEDLRERLKELPGVGEKVADCVSLFGFGRLEAFPIDVWMDRALRRLYGQKGSYERLRQFATDRFGPFAGYAQEYLYFNERTMASKGFCRFSEKRVD